MSKSFENLRAYKIGSRTVFEGWANAVTLMLLRKRLGFEEWQPIATEIHKDIYQRFFGLLHRNFPEPYKRDYFLLCLNICAVAELSVNPDIFYRGSTRGKLDWLEVHPGWRVVNAVKIIQQENIQPIDIMNWGEDFSEFQREICNHLGWSYHIDARSDIKSMLDISLNCSDINLDSLVPDKDKLTKLMIELFSSGYNYSIEYPGAIAAYPINRMNKTTWPAKYYPSLLIIGSDGIMRTEDTQFLLPFHILLLYALALMRMPNSFSRSEFLQWVFPNIKGYNVFEEPIGIIFHNACW